jgi:predicted ATPase
VGGSLPRPATSFIGRERDFGALLALFAREEVRLVTLTGPGGVGKTRLALHVAEHVREQGEEVWFVSLAAIRDPAVAPATIAASLDARPDVTLTAEQAISVFLRNRRGLLVLDNLEHVLGVADQVPGLLEACPRLRLLVTSRVPLNLSAEQVHVVRPFGTDDQGVPQAVRLFVERARLRQSEFQLDEKTTEEVTRICQVLDGLPLAIELAAARVATMTLQDILRRVVGSLDLLAGGPRDVPPRQRTLRETIAWSYAIDDLNVPLERALTGGSGQFANASGVQVETNLGFNASGGMNFRYEIHLVER